MALVTNPFSYAAGVGAATVTVPTGYVVTGITCVASSGGGTLTITPNGPGFTAGIAGSAITVPGSDSFSLPLAALVGSSFQLGAGTILVFSAGIASYYVQYQLSGPG